MATTLATREVTGGHRFRSRPFTTERLRHADLVLTAENAHRTFILDDQFTEAVRGPDAELTGRDLLAAVATRRGTPDPDLDIPDPYGQGPEAAEACATSIEALLRVLLPALTGSRIITA